MSTWATPIQSGNPYADMLLGNLNSYTETSYNRINDIFYNTYEGFVQDSWKVNRRLTLELGMRITHFAPWSDNLGFGFSVFDYSKYSSSCTPTQYCGFLWNKRDPSVPMGGFPTKGAYFQPRFGVAYSLTDSTVLRGGWGRYYYHSGQFTTGLNVSAGMQTVTLSNNQGTGGNTPLLASELDTLNYNTSALSTGAVDRNDDKSPVTDSYSFTISQRVPGSGLLEVAYVGNQSRNLLNQSGVGSDINLVPVGAMLSSKNGGADPNGLNANNFRPLLGFAGLPLATHNLYANYNSAQIKYLRTKGRAVISVNYTFGKALGIVSSTLDQFNINNDYGVQSTNRHAHLQRGVLLQLREFRAQQGGGRHCERLAGVGHHATAERPEPHGTTRADVQHGAEQREDSGYYAKYQRDFAAGDSEYHALAGSHLQPDVEPGAEPVHQSELLLIPDADRPERTDHAAGDLRAGVFQHGPRPVQELRGYGEEEGAIAHERVQLPESSVVEL